MGIARAGWAQVEITPPLGLPLGGRGPRFTPAAAVLDPLSAQAVVLEDSAGGRTLWVSLDLIGISECLAGPIRSDLAAAASVPGDAVVLNFAHTHSGPMAVFDRYIRVRPKPAELADYERELHRRLVELARDAAARLAPVAVTWRRGCSDIAINRRLRNASGQVELKPNPRGYRNAELWVLELAGADRRCVVFCHACHPVIVYGYAYDAISADFPGRCRRRLRERLGPDVHCQFFQSFAGNVRPKTLADLTAAVFRKPAPEDLRAVGDQLAQDVLATLAQPGEALELRLAARAGAFRAPLAEPPPLEHWQSLAGDQDPFSRVLAEYWLTRYRAGPPLARTIDWPVGLVRLDDAHWIAWMAGEVFAEWLTCLRSWLGKRELMAWGYCQRSAPYLPTEELLAEGGYEIDRAPAYGVDGPAALAGGLNAAARGVFEQLGRELS